MIIGVVRFYLGENVSNIVITIIGLSFIFLMTTLGSAVVFLFKNNINEKVRSIMLGFASGLMMAASVWSLIIPAIEQSDFMGNLNFVPAAVGILLGCIFLVLMDKIIPYFLNKDKKFDNHFQMKKSTKLFIAVTLHNIPEGLAVGLAFGNAFLTSGQSVFISALWLAIGIGIQNFPEGAAISLPMKDELKSKKKAFLYGTLSGAIEPIMALIGIWLSTSLSSLMPWFLSFSAGAMLFVVAEELLPDAKNNKFAYIGSWGFIFGFVLMMILDVALG